MTVTCYLYAYAVLVLLQILVDSSSASCVFDNEEDLPGAHAVCPTWLRAVPAENNSYTCVCGEVLQISDLIDCTEQPPHVELNVIYPVCVHYITECNITVAGACPYSVRSRNTTDFFLALPTNVSQLNDYMCGPLNRKGLLCRQCMDGYSPSVLSYIRS